MTKANKLPNLKENFKFEAPILPASIRGGKQLTAVNMSSLDLYSLLVPKTSGIFMVQVSGESMIDEGIYNHDILIVDKNEQPSNGQVVIAALNGELLVKTYREIDGKVYLFSANKNFLPIEIFPDWAFEIQGLVKYCIHNMV